MARMHGVIDWNVKVRELRSMADELEQLASRSEGRFKMILGRTVDDLRRFSAQIEVLLATEERAHEPQHIPEWLQEALEQEPEPWYPNEEDGDWADDDSEEGW